MRRYLVLFLLCLLSLQISWAAVASYCQHETGAATHHLGHHAHQHHDQDRPADKERVSIKFDGDCSVCQFGALGMMAPAAPPQAAAPLAAGPTATSPHHPSSSPPDRPERPKWTPAA